MGFSVNKFFLKFDSNKDGILDEQELIKLLSECQLVFGKNMLEILLKEILDPI
jgi:Ca2+-binding EF-hand superfamily protein